MEQNPFADLQINDFRFLDELQDRTECEKCGRTRKYYCYTCFLPMSCIREKLPRIKLPVKVHIIKHPNEVDGKSTAAHAAILAPDDVSVFTYPVIPDYKDRSRVILIFPGDASTTLEALAESLKTSTAPTLNSRTDLNTPTNDPCPDPTTTTGTTTKATEAEALAESLKTSTAPTLNSGTDLNTQTNDPCPDPTTTTGTTTKATEAEALAESLKTSTAPTLNSGTDLNTQTNDPCPDPTTTTGTTTKATEAETGGRTDQGDQNSALPTTAGIEDSKQTEGETETSKNPTPSKRSLDDSDREEGPSAAKRRQGQQLEAGAGTEEPFDCVVFIDSTWNQTMKIYKDERLRGLRQVELKSRTTKFWRHQRDKPTTYLATIEAIYNFFKDYHSLFIDPAGTSAYDNLLFFFAYMYQKIRFLYDGGKNLKAYQSNKK